jgi:hypothetical protein
MKNAIFFAEDWEKSQKIVIIPSAPDDFVKEIAQNEAQSIFVTMNAYP